MDHPALSQFQRRQLIFEMRYDPAYALWDRAGAVASELSRHFPELKNQNANPNVVGFVASQRYNLNILIDRASFVDNKPIGSQKELVAEIDFFYKVLSKNLSITSFSRIGLRVIFSRQYSSSDDAANAARGYELMKLPDRKYFGIEPVSIKPHYRIEADNGSIGYIYQIYSHTRSLNLDLAPDVYNFMDMPTFLEKYELNVDIDIFTKKTISSEVFSPHTVVADWVKTIHAEADRFVDGVR